MELTIGELAATASAAVSAADVRGANRRVTDLPDERTIRWYATIGLLDKPSGNRGRTALYGERHLLQLVAIKRLQAEGYTLAEIQDELVGATDRTLRKVAALPRPVEAHAEEGRRFWRERPVRPDAGDGLLTGIDLGGGAVLMLPVRPDAPDVDAVRAAAQPLLDLLAERRLIKGGRS